VVLAIASWLGWCPSAFALNPALDVSQYGHTAWRIREGFAKGAAWTIAQTPDGYLWLGTEFGLLRFDGTRAVAWLPPPDQALPSLEIRTLLTSRDGTLWIATTKGLASWKDGRVTRYPQLDGQLTYSLAEDRQGAMWVGTIAYNAAKLCVIQHTVVDCQGGAGRFGHGVLALHEDTKGNLWASVSNGLWRWKPGSPEFHPVPGAGDSIQGFDDGPDGTLSLATRVGLMHLVGGKAKPTVVPGVARGLRVKKLLRDRDGGLWMGTFQGLVHVHRNQVDAFALADGLSDNDIKALFEDREGNVWVSTASGLDRFRDAAVPIYSVRQGLSGSISSVLTTRGGRVLIATTDGLAEWTDEHFSIGKARNHTQNAALDGRVPHSLFEDHRGRIWVSTLDGVGYFEHDRFTPVRGVPGGSAVHSMAEDSEGTMWIASQDKGLFGVSREGAVNAYTWPSLGRKDFAYTLAGDPARGGLWLGFLESGVAYFKDGRIRASYNASSGLGEGLIHHLQLDARGTLWIGTQQHGLSRLRDNRVDTLTSRNGLPCDAVHWAVEDDAHNFWLYLSCGLVRIAAAELDGWSEAAKETGKAVPTIQVTVFDGSDGVPTSTGLTGLSPVVTKSRDGSLWFATEAGAGLVNPAHFRFNRLVPPVHIEGMIADRKSYPTISAGIQLPALVRDLQIDYTALSLVAPEKVHFRYKLEGWDQEWQEVGNRRQAYYNSLPPRAYRFRVIAANNSGVWNETGAALDFSIAPAYYQTLWFRLSVAFTFVALLWAAYRYRLRQAAYEFDARLQERVNERTRIARDLHDTLLQSFHGLLFRFQAASNLLPDRPAEAKQKLDNAIDQAARALTEGRGAVQQLRATGVETDLAIAIGTLIKELSAYDGDSVTRPVVNVAVEGTPRDLHPLVRDDIYRIAGEALRNAFRHAHATHVEVDIRYEEKQLQVRVRDDGRGIDPTLLEGRKPGHFGLAGIRERAHLIGGRVEVWSQVGIGTELDLKVPAHAAYAAFDAKGRVSEFAVRSSENS
jgi:signal transduction histidine kinase/ligand-binding sensor domain-containing protein